MRIILFIMFFTSFNLYSQELEYQLYLKNPCNDSIQKADFYSLIKGKTTYGISNLDNPTIKVPVKGVYKLLSKETNEEFSVNISSKNLNDTLLLSSVYEYIKHPLPPSYKKGISKSELKKRREEGRSVYKKCDSRISGAYKDYFSNGKLRFYGSFNNGFAIGEVKEFYSNGNIKSILVYDKEGFLIKKQVFSIAGVEIIN